MRLWSGWVWWDMAALNRLTLDIIYSRPILNHPDWITIQNHIVLNMIWSEKQLKTFNMIYLTSIPFCGPTVYFFVGGGAPLHWWGMGFINFGILIQTPTYSTSCSCQMHGSQKWLKSLRRDSSSSWCAKIPPRSLRHHRHDPPHNRCALQRTPWSMSSARTHSETRKTWYKRGNAYNI